MSDAFSALAQGKVYQPLRTIIRPPDARGLLGLMPSFKSDSDPAFGIKVITVFPDNPKQGKDAHQGAVLLFSTETGEILAMMNASAITAQRTAAASGLATRLLSRKDAKELAVIGAGVQARTHIRAISCVRSIKRARIASRGISNAQKLANEMRLECDFELVPVETAKDAVEGADIIVTATNSHDPVLQRDWISPGAHINAIGTHSPSSREIDGQTMAAARIFVDRRESAINESGDYILAEKEGLIDRNSIIAEIGEVLVGESVGRTNDAEITLFKSLGLAIEDVVCAQYLLRAAKEQQIGTFVGY
jgi:ornithine cyclodeaminase/alanine dehydrogenase-like protein (mu-crystallin family)